MDSRQALVKRSLWSATLENRTLFFFSLEGTGSSSREIITLSTLSLAFISVFDFLRCCFVVCALGSVWRLDKKHGGRRRRRSERHRFASSKQRKRWSEPRIRYISFEQLLFWIQRCCSLQRPHLSWSCSQDEVQVRFLSPPLCLFLLQFNLSLCSLLLTFLSFFNLIFC